MKTLFGIEQADSASLRVPCLHSGAQLMLGLAGTTVRTAATTIHNAALLAQSASSLLHQSSQAAYRGRWARRARRLKPTWAMRTKFEDADAEAKCAPSQSFLSFVFESGAHAGPPILTSCFTRWAQHRIPPLSESRTWPPSSLQFPHVATLLWDLREETRQHCPSRAGWGRH